MLVGGLDLGQRTDATALATLKMAEGGKLTLPRLDYLPVAPMGAVPFAAQLEFLRPSLEALDALIVDSGGVGQAVFEMIASLNLPRLRLLVPAVIVGGAGPHVYRNGRLTVPKRKLVADLLAVIGEGRLVVSPSAPGAGILRDEMAAFVFVKGSNGKRMEAKTGSHDDAVMALALGVALAGILRISAPLSVASP